MRECGVCVCMCIYGTSLSHSPTTMWESQAYVTRSRFHMGSGDQNSGPPTYGASTSVTKPSLRPQDCKYLKAWYLLLLLKDFSLLEMHT